MNKDKREEIKEAFRRYFLQSDDVEKLNKEIDKIINDIERDAVFKFCNPDLRQLGKSSTIGDVRIKNVIVEKTSVSEDISLPRSIQQVNLDQTFSKAFKTMIEKGNAIIKIQLGYEKPQGNLLLSVMPSPYLDPISELLENPYSEF